MARSNLMAWEGAPRFRWVKMYRGVRYKVYCKEKGWTLTKEGSYQQANQWWLATLATIQPPPLPVVRLQTTEATERALQELDVGNQELEKLIAIKKAGGQATIEYVDSYTRQQVPKEKTIGPNVDRFLELERARGMKPQTYREIANYLDEMTETEFMSKGMDCAEVTEATVTAHYLWLTAKNCSPNYGNKRIGFFRRFVLWLKSEKLLPALPENIKLKTHRFKERRKAIRKFDNVAEVLAALPERFRLWALLGLNCGMTQADLGALTWEMIDKKKWTLTRYRVKTDGVKDAPTVTYKLWKETRELLAKLDTQEGLVFRTTNDTPLYTTKFDAQANGETKETKTDLFSTYWNRLDPKPAIPLGKFRSIGSTCLKASAETRGFVDVFLANVPDTIADKHYAGEHDEPFFKALQFIHQQIFGE